MIAVVSYSSYDYGVRDGMYKYPFIDQFIIIGLGRYWIYELINDFPQFVSAHYMDDGNRSLQKTIVKWMKIKQISGAVNGERRLDLEL